MHSPDDIPPPTDPILVVDDEKIFLSALLQTLHRAGYPAVAHDSPLEALKELSLFHLAIGFITPVINGTHGRFKSPFRVQVYGVGHAYRPGQHGQSGQHQDAEAYQVAQHELLRRWSVYAKLVHRSPTRKRGMGISLACASGYDGHEVAISY